MPRGHGAMARPRARNSNGAARRRVRSWLRSQGRGCWICRAFGRPDAIDYSLPAGHPLSFEVDELVPFSLGGSATDPRNVDAAHRCCNEWRGNRTVAEVLAIAREGKGGTKSAPARAEGAVSRDW